MTWPDRDFQKNLSGIQSLIRSDFYLNDQDTSELLFCTEQITPDLISKYTSIDLICTSGLTKSITIEREVDADRNPGTYEIHFSDFNDGPWAPYLTVLGLLILSWRLID